MQHVNCDLEDRSKSTCIHSFLPSLSSATTVRPLVYLFAFRVMLTAAPEDNSSFSVWHPRQSWLIKPPARHSHGYTRVYPLVHSRSSHGYTHALSFSHDANDSQLRRKTATIAAPHKQCCFTCRNTEMTINPIQEKWIVTKCNHYARCGRLCRSAWVGFSSPSVCLSAA